MNNVKSAIITGSSKGLGAAIAKQLSMKGFYYFPVSRYYELDVGNYEIIKDYFNKLDCCPEVLINNAGICKSGSILEMNVNDWNEQINTNLNGVFYCCKEYIKLCKKYNIKGKIINIASTAGTGRRPGRAGYAASKAAVISLSQSLSEELKTDGIKVYCLCPAAFDSDLRREICPEDNFNTMLKPEAIAKFITKIVIDEYEFLDNQVIYVRKWDY